MAECARGGRASEHDASAAEPPNEQSQGVTYVPGLICPHVPGRTKAMAESTQTESV
jgi:hypothetical protein